MYGPDSTRMHEAIKAVDVAIGNLLQGVNFLFIIFILFYNLFIYIINYRLLYFIIILYLFFLFIYINFILLFLFFSFIILLIYQNIFYFYFFFIKIYKLEDRKMRDQINVIVVADHGMTEISQDRVVFVRISHFFSYFFILFSHCSFL